MYRLRLMALAGCCAAILWCPTAQAAQINLATGLNSGGALQLNPDALDAWWQVTGAVNPLNPPNAYVTGLRSPDGDPAWAPNGPRSAWISANPDDRFGNGFMTFTRTFTVNDPSTVSLTGGMWTIDDEGVLLLNGHVLSTLTAGHWVSLNPFSAAPSDFVTGLNTLTIQMTATDIEAEGARLEGILSGDISGGPPSVPVPEPNTWALTLVGFGILGWAARRRANRVRLGRVTAWGWYG